MKRKSKVDRAELQRIYRRVLALIKKKSGSFFKLAKLRGVMGWCEWEDGIKIDYRKEFIPTLIHECIHYLYPDWPETKVLYMEKRVINILSSRQVVSLLKAFVCRL
jgi:hypothetical protein